LKKKKKVEAHTIDVLSHDFVPEMKVLADAEKTKLLHKYGIDQTQLPKILSTDPSALALKAVAGDVIKIDRDDGTGKYISYRVVIEG
jgi:DNA-directed RNA polymerases I, II, and III subunit RPABC1